MASAIILNAIRKSRFKQVELNDLIEISFSGEWGKDIFDTKAKKEKNNIKVKVLRNTNFDNSLNLSLVGVAERLIDKNKFNKIKLEDGDLLIEKSGGSPIQPVGRVAIFEDIKGNYCFSNFLQCIRLNKEICLPYYLFIYLKAVYRLNYMEYLQNQTTGIKNLIWEEFVDIPIALPSKEVQEKLAKEAKNRMVKAARLREEVKTILSNAIKEVEQKILN